MTTLPLLTARTAVADYLDKLIWVYTLVIFAYIISTWVSALGLRIPYSRWTDAILGFLRDVSEPYLRLFRQFIRPIGGFDFSVIIAVLVLQFGGAIVVSLIHG